MAPILLLAVTIPVWAVPQAATRTETQSAATSRKTTKSPAKKKSAKAPASTTSATPAPTPAPVTTPAPATKKAAKRAPKKSTARAAATASKRETKATRPPKNLHRVSDHWTAYNPPDPGTYPAGAKTYAIKRGDTLWGLATQFYNNGYMWPQLWETNTWITDAHWIYPGDVLLVEGEISQQAESGGTTGTGTMGTTGTTGTTGGTGTSTTGGTLGATSGNPLGGQTVRPLITAADAVGGTAGPVPLATEADIYCYGYIGDPNEPMPNEIFAWEDAELRYQAGTVLAETKADGSEGDLVFITGGSSSGLTAGETYMLVAPRGLIHHPRTKETVGRQYDYIGQVKVLCLDGQQARGIITKSCAEIPIGARLKPMPQLPIPLARIPSIPAFCDPSSGKRRGYIISAEGGDWLQAIGEGFLVQINLGRDEQVQPGEFLTVFRENVQPGAPPQVLGEMAVLTAENHTATAKIVLMRYSMMVGDAVEIR
ncbi:MAG: LysM peptidoglycan-binding domain-containing protein [Acidobacteriota bacterium]|nr:LysM peptidoglycan-binding domain-containing protein [Acidobacteriota bacterium]